MFKTCNKCTNHLSINKFHKLKKGLYGYHPTCKLCRSDMRKRKNIEVELTSKKCSSCHKEMEVNHFYKNKNSNDGLQSYCKKCHKIKISESNSKLNKFCKIILEKFKKKNKEKVIKIDYKDLIKKYKEQNKVCFVTGHSMTHKSDIKQRTDNIWNLSIFVDKDINEINYNNFNLVANLIYSVKEIYNLSNNETINICKKFIT